MQVGVTLPTYIIPFLVLHYSSPASHLLSSSRSITGKSSLRIPINTTKSGESYTTRLTPAVQFQSTVTKRSVKHRKHKRMPNVPKKRNSELSSCLRSSMSNARQFPVQHVQSLQLFMTQT